MATVRYRVDGLPASKGWSAAFTPMPPLTPQGTFSLRRFIHGFPGTMRIPTDLRGGQVRGSYGVDTNYNASGTLSESPEYFSPSSVAPDWFAPQLWWHDINELQIGPTASGRGVSYLPHRRAMPVPPVTPIGQLGPLGPPKVAQTGRKIGGRRSMKWPRVVVRWPNLRGEYDE